MKILLLIISTSLFLNCSNESPKDPWQGIKDPTFTSSNFSHSSKADLSSKLEFKKVSSDVELSSTVTCKDSTGETAQRSETFKPHEFKSDIHLFKILPKEALLEPEKFNICNFDLIEKNSRKSSNSISITDVEISDFFSTSTELSVIGENIEVNKEDGLILSNHIDNYWLTTPIESTSFSNSTMICAEAEFSQKNSTVFDSRLNLNKFSIVESQEFPIQRCRVFSIVDNSFVMHSKRFILQTKVPEARILTQEYVPANFSQFLYDSSMPLEMPLLNFEIVNEFPFPIHYQVSEAQSNGFSLYAHFYKFVGHNPLKNVLFQNINASLEWSADKELSDSRVLTLQQGEKVVLKLNLKSNFICLVGRPTDKTRASGGGNTHPEHGLSFQIPRSHPIFDLSRLQIKGQQDPVIVQKDFLRNSFSSETLSTEYIHPRLSENMIEDYFYKETDLYENRVVTNIIDEFRNRPQKENIEVKDFFTEFNQYLLNVCAYL